MDMIARCPSCRFMFEAGTPGLLPACPQCSGPTVAVVKIAPVQERALTAHTLKFQAQPGSPR
jgi:hypothetical protein